MLVVKGSKGFGCPLNCKRMKTGREGAHLQCDRSHINVLIEHLVVKLLRKITRFLVSFIKIPVLLEPCSKNGVLCC